MQLSGSTTKFLYPSQVLPTLGPEVTPPIVDPMYLQDFHRDRLVIMPFERELIDLVGSDTRVDWETAFSWNFHRKRLVPQDYSNDHEIFPSENITLDKYYQRLPEPVRIIPRMIPVSEVFLNLETDENVTVDKYDNPLMRILPQSKRRFSRLPLEKLGEDPIPTPDTTLDMWYSQLSEPPMIYPEWLRTRIEEFDPEPIPDTPLLPTRIPWDVSLSYEFHVRRVQTPRMDAFVNLTTDENITVDKYESWQNQVPWRSKMPIALFPFPVEPESQDPENVTLDKYYTPLSYNFHVKRGLVPPFGQLRESDEAENVTLDKYYSPLSEPMRTPPWLRLIMESRDPFPIPDIPGVTGQYWYASMSLPQQLFTQPKDNDKLYLRLYLAFQDFPIPPATARLHESPRRRVSSRVNTTCP